MSDHEDWDPSQYDQTAAPPPVEHYGVEKPDRWYRDNAAVFHALEGWQRGWEEYCERYESENGRRPSSYNRDKNKSAFQRRLYELYGRREPDQDWIASRITWLERRGSAPERTGFSR